MHDVRTEWFCSASSSQHKQQEETCWKHSQQNETRWHLFAGVRMGRQLPGVSRRPRGRPVDRARHDGAQPGDLLHRDAQHAHKGRQPGLRRPQAARTRHHLAVLPGAHLPAVCLQACSPPHLYSLQSFDSSWYICPLRSLASSSVPATACPLSLLPNTTLKFQVLRFMVGRMVPGVPAV